MKYLLAAFNARPLGMPVPPNWFAVAAIGLLGAFVHPGFLIIGAGLELGYLALLSRSRRFQRVVDGDTALATVPDRHAELLAALPLEERAIQAALELRGAELSELLQRTGALTGQDETAQLCWLHLRLLAARQGAAAVANGGERDLERRRATIARQLAANDPDEAVRGSLASQLAVLDERLKGQREAAARLRFIDAELERIRQQVELAREQALLAPDAAGLARSVDLVAGSLGEANRWLGDRRDILADLDPLAEAPSANRLFAPRAKVAQ